jgi:hypothetical protein
VSEAKAEKVASATILSSPAVSDPDDIRQRETLTNGFGGLNDTLADSGASLRAAACNKDKAAFVSISDD